MSTKKVELNSKVSNEELQEVFNYFDKTNTGFINIKKLKVVMRALGFEPRQQEIETMTSQMLKNEAARAVNKDAFSIEELSYLLEEKIGARDSKDEISSTFKLFDVENKGFIDFDDLKRISTELGEDINDLELQEMISEATQTNSGRVTVNEFEKIMMKTALY